MLLCCKISDLFQSFSTSCFKPRASNRGVKVETVLKMKKRITVRKGGFLNASILTLANLVLHAFVTTCLHHCNILYVGVDQASRSHLQMVQKAAAAHLLTETLTCEHMTPCLQSLHTFAFNGLSPT